MDKPIGSMGRLHIYLHENHKNQHVGKYTSSSHGIPSWESHRSERSMEDPIGRWFSL